jgi:hypothetical protein
MFSVEYFKNFILIQVYKILQATPSSSFLCGCCRGYICDKKIINHINQVQAAVPIAIKRINLKRR